MIKDYKVNFTVFDGFEEIYLALNEELKIILSNKFARNFLFSEIVNPENLSVYNIIRSSDHIRFKDLINNSLKSQLSETDNFLIDFNNKHFHSAVTVTPVPSESTNHSAFGFLILIKDLSEEKEREQEFLKFYKIAENTVNPLQITDVNGKMIYVNNAFVQASGYTRDELIGQNPKIFSSGKNKKQFWKKMWDTISEGRVWMGEIENRKKNGEPYYTQLLISPILDYEGKVTGYFGIHRDLSEKRVLERQLIHTQKMESIGTLAAGIAHEVGNPLASISALVQVALRSTKDQFIIEKLGLVKNQVTRISKIIRDLVDFSRPSNYELQLTDINETLREAVEITKVGTKAKNIEFEVLTNEKIPHLPLIADQIQQVFVNILLNAVDAINEVDKENGADKKIKVVSDITDDHIVLKFSDTGTGIPEEFQAKVFEPFFTTKKEGKGTGLGLWVSYGIVKSFQGDIKLESKVNKGTTFTITLPIHT
jgi:PAS domain S-box-containing protein